MKKTTRILLLEDNINDAELIIKTLEKEKTGYEFRVAMNKKDFVTALDEFKPEAVLSDHSMPQFSSNEALGLARKRLLYAPFILVTGSVSEEFASTILKEGADDYILKDRLTRLPAAIDTAIKKRRGLKEIIDYRYALDQSSIVAITDERGSIIYANNNFCEVSKYTVEELIGSNFAIVNSGWHSTDVMNDMWSTIIQGRIWRGEFRNKSKDGNFYWADTTIVPFIDEEGTPYQYMAICKDISERKRAQDELFQSNQRFQYAIRASSDIIWELNFETNQFVVHEGKEMNLESITRHSWKMGIAGKHMAKADKFRIKLSFLKAMLDPLQELWVAEYKGYLNENSLSDIINHAIFIRNEKGIATRVIGAITDITEKKKLEAELLEQQIKQQEKILAMSMEAQEKERNLIGQELHDNVNQILAGTKLLLSSLLKETRTNKPVVRQSIGYVQEAINENRKIAHVLVTPDFHVNTFLGQVSNLIKTMFGSTKLKVTIDTTELDEHLLSDALKLTLYRIVQEQCVNILKYANAGNLYICLYTGNGLFDMSIADDGDGMEHYSNSQGIGLSNIRNRLSVFNGRSKITSSKGNGFVLEVSVPLQNIVD